MKTIRTHLFSTAFVAALTALPLVQAQAAQTLPQNMPAGVYNLDETHASIIWKVSHLGLSDYTARFTEFDADLTFDPATPENSSLTATINPLSVETDFPYPEKKDFDAVLAEGEDWFNGTAFPEITFVSTSIERTGDKTGIMTGDLTFLGVTKPLTFDVEFNGAMAQQPFSQKPTLGFSATGKMKRSDWGMSTYVPNIGDDVEILIEAEFAQDKVVELNE